VTAPAPADVRHCIKCGREIGPDETICEVCNRAGMATPSATQYQRTVVVAIVAAIVALAVAASLSLRGVGPYAATISRVAPSASVGYEITLIVQNDGTRQGRAKCQIVVTGAAGQRLGVRSLVTVPIDGGASVTATELLTSVREEPAEVTATCS
jgi:predicted nucleic acid-binding Zn ribbon protein